MFKILLIILFLFSNTFYGMQKKEDVLSDDEKESVSYEISSTEDFENLIKKYNTTNARKIYEFPVSSINKIKVQDIITEFYFSGEEIETEKETVIKIEYFKENIVIFVKYLGFSAIPKKAIIIKDKKEIILYQ
jgi:hypothetical protein